MTTCTVNIVHLTWVGFSKKKKKGYAEGFRDRKWKVLKPCLAL